MLRATLKPLPLDVDWLVSFSPCEGPFRNGPGVQTIELKHGYDLDLDLGSLGKYLLRTTLGPFGQPVIHVENKPTSWLDRVLGVSYRILSDSQTITVFDESKLTVVNISARSK